MLQKEIRGREEKHQRASLEEECMIPNLAWSGAASRDYPPGTEHSGPCCPFPTSKPSPRGLLGDSPITFPEPDLQRNEAAAASPGKLMEFAREY